MKTFITFDGATIAYHDEGEGSPVILLHGYGVDGLGQFGNFERILPLLQKRQTLLIEAAPPVPDPPVDGRGSSIKSASETGSETGDGSPRLLA